MNFLCSIDFGEATLTLYTHAGNHDDIRAQTGEWTKTSGCTGFVQVVSRLRSGGLANQG